MNVFMLVLLALAAARATHLVTDDLFPFGPLRDRLDKSKNSLAQYIGYGLNCTFCISVWAGAAAAGLASHAGWLTDGFPTFVVTWWAIAGAIVLLEGIQFRLMED